MAHRFYLLPAVVTVRSDGTTVTKPKYLELLSTIPMRENMPYGKEPVYLLCADVTTEQHNALVANADVAAFPANLESLVGGAEAATEAALESFNIPGDWVAPGMSFRFVLRVIVGVFQLTQRYKALAQEDNASPALFPAGVTLSTPYSDMPVPYRQRLLEAIDSLGYDRSMLDNNSTLRQLLREIGLQQAPLTMCGQAI